MSDTLSISDKVDLIKRSKKNANYLVEIISELKSDSETSRTTASDACWQVFSHFFTDKEWVKSKERHHQKQKQPLNVQPANLTADEQFYDWIHGNYEQFLAVCLDMLSSGQSSEARSYLNLLMKFLLLEYQTISKSGKFPSNLFIRILRSSIETRETFCVDELAQQYFVYADVRFYTLKNIPNMLNSADKQSHQQAQQQTAQQRTPQQGASVARNVYTLLTAINLPADEVKQADMYINQSNVDKLVVDTVYITKKFRATCSKAWFSLLREASVTGDIQKQILLDMDTKIIPSVTDPKMLIDFLTDSYNKGGATSLLALNSLFTLMQGYNLDYPDFYGKLYSLFQTSTFHVKYKARLYNLSNLFFSSSHMPAYLVAAFIKRMGRLCLFAPPADILAMLALIKNLLVRNPAVRLLIHRSNMTSVTGDPYDFTEPDPAKCDAIRSSLWELQALGRHHHADVLKQVHSFKKEMGKQCVEEDVRKHLETSYESIIMDLLSKDLDNSKEVPTNFERPTSFLDASTFDTWSI